MRLNRRILLKQMRAIPLVRSPQRCPQRLVQTLVDSEEQAVLELLGDIVDEMIGGDVVVRESGSDGADETAVLVGLELGLQIRALLQAVGLGGGVLDLCAFRFETVVVLADAGGEAVVPQLVFDLVDLGAHAGVVGNWLVLLAGEGLPGKRSVGIRFCDAGPLCFTYMIRSCPWSQSASK